MTSPNLRLFVAVSLPRSHLERVAEATQDLRARWPAARWMKTENQHITLKFLGSTPPERVDGVRAATRDVARNHEASAVALSDLGVFPGPRRARVLWIGLDDPGDLLTSLARALDAALQPLGYEPEKRPFHPHLTLARFRTPERLGGDLPVLGLDLEPVVIESVELFRSHLHPKGARYEVLESFPLLPSARHPGPE